MAVVSQPVRRRRWGGRIGPNLILVGCGLFFTLPLLAQLRFALQNVPVVLLGWSTFLDKWSLKGITQAFGEPGFSEALTLSLKLAAGTVIITLALLIPTAVWVHLRLPKARPVIEFLTLLPYVIPAIALVAGISVIKPHARWFLNSELSLIPFYVVLALPFTYRSIDAGLRALDLRTLVDASRSLGAGWGTTLRRVLLPNLRSSIISATFLIVAVVLGEYTMANVVLRENLAVFLVRYRGSEPQAGQGLAVVALITTMLIFALLSRLTRPRRDGGIDKGPDLTTVAYAGLSKGPDR